MFDDITVLVADDEHAICRMIQRIGEAIGFTMCASHTIPDTLSALNKNPPDILFLDLKINGGDSPDVILDQWVSRFDRPVCIISGYITNELESSLIVRGATNVLRKPFDASVIQTVLHRYGRIIVQSRRYAALSERLNQVESRIKRLININVALALLCAAVGGVEILPRVAALLF